MEKRKVLTEEDKQWIKDRQKIMSDKEMISVLGCSAHVFYKFKRQEGLAKNVRWTPEEDDILRSLWWDTPIEDICQQLPRHANAGALYTRASYLKVPRYRQRFTEKEVEYILANVGKKRSVEISRDLGRSDAAVQQWLTQHKVSSQYSPWFGREEDKEAFCKYYKFYSNAELQQMFPYLTLTQIVSQGRILKLNPKEACRMDLMGHRCYSQAEQDIGNWLYQHNIQYIKDGCYRGYFPDFKDASRFDWYLPEYDCFIEYFGLFGAGGKRGEEYRQRVREKIAEFERLEIPVLYLYPQDFSKNVIWNKIISFLNP